MIRYKSTQRHANADALSRLPAGPDDSFTDKETIQINHIQTELMDEWPVDAATLQSAVNNDTILKMVKNFTLIKWPDLFSKKNNSGLIPYYNNRNKLSVVNIYLLKATCAKHASMPKQEFESWPESDNVWSRVHVDFAGPIYNSKWFIIVDAKSKFSIVAEMGNSTTATALRNVFQQATDRLDSPFNSQEMVQFYNKYDI